MYNMAATFTLVPMAASASERVWESVTCGARDRTLRGMQACAIKVIKWNKTFDYFCSSSRRLGFFHQEFPLSLFALYI